MLQIIVPMAGAGSRFAVAGYKDPKPLIPVHGVPMIKVVIDNLTPNVTTNSSLSARPRMLQLMVCAKNSALGRRVARS